MTDTPKPVTRREQVARIIAEAANEQMKSVSITNGRVIANFNVLPVADKILSELSTDAALVRELVEALEVARPYVNDPVRARINAALTRAKEAGYADK